MVEHTGLTLEELEAQRMGLLPERIELRRHKKRRRRNLPVGPGYDCMALYIPGYTCTPDGYVPIN